ncbi:hypothetical protein NEUTE1DRAFT_126682 [Neurospora tetrasperma FGSC 2508]|uniref:Uncharacterized protein n=1 Tax=Neurospora tetrasperma (strain FGSC 2508 / ATCC MYA-4615 / P0657) TaxID=510951 RepID=F8N2U4_NEUT8|nr:uncharacterized protein NEUTE1DRAFT_126682 [Neurospora tetrasperma FGSC 2508]EGO53358.1 hypothetical protein NEUTE1DRAFT_126682 [Neurospora tetrasperma FGSC 2508]
MPVTQSRIPIRASQPSLEPNAVSMAVSLWPRIDIAPDPNAPSSQKPTQTSIIVAIVVAVIALMLSITLTLRAVRARHPNPKYIPTPFLKRLWTKWKVPPVKHAYAQAGIDEEYNSHNRANQDAMEETLTAVNARLAAAAGRTGATGGTTAEVNRNQSIRSIMTLPAYRPAPAENERVLGREGERDGIDVVVEMPTAEDEEHLRDEEMEALYQIRVARRRANQEREERRRLRQEARQAHNTAALRQIREQARVQTARNTEELEVLREEHNRIRELRSRATSSVQYADLGVARADGTRIRANSTESERVGLLSDAASMAASQQGVRPSTSATHHRRGSSSLSIDTSRLGDQFLDSSAVATPLTGAGGSSTFSLVTRNSHERGRSISRSRANSAANTPRAGSSPEMIDADDADLGAVNMPPPPGYEDVRLDDLTPFRSPVASAAVSGRNSPTTLTPLPYNEPPPEYPGPSPAPSAEETSLSTRTDGGRTLAHQRSISGGGGVGTGNLPTRLPSLRLDSVPLIVVEPEEEIRIGEGSNNNAASTEESVSNPPNINITFQGESSTARTSVSESFRTSTESDSGEETSVTTKGKKPERTIEVNEQVEKEKGNGSGAVTANIDRSESTRSTTAARDKESHSPPVGEGIKGTSARMTAEGADP